MDWDNSTQTGDWEGGLFSYMTNCPLPLYSLYSSPINPRTLIQPFLLSPSAADDDVD